MQGCGKRERIDSIAARMLRRHIEVTVLPRVFHAAVNDANRTGDFRCCTTRTAFEGKRPGRCARASKEAVFPQSPPPAPPAPPPLEPWSARSQVRSCG